jgi:acetyltransferase-like isoleucine patch superfamily enzyme
MRLVRLALAGAALVHGRVATRFWSLVAYMKLRAHGATVGPGLRVRGPIHLHCHHSASIQIGRDCRVNSGFAGNAVGGSTRMAFWVGPGGRLILGDRVGLSNSTIVCLRSVTIEDDVFLGGDCKVDDTDFHALDFAERSQPGNPGARTAAVTIRRRAFVGGHSILLKGTTIGEAAVVGAGSVVRSAIPDRQVWAGNPALFVRRLDATTSPAYATAGREATR